MHRFALGHLTDVVLKCELAASNTDVSGSNSQHLARLAEFDARQLFRAEGYPSMVRYCVGELKLPEDVAYKRISAARTAMAYPEIFEAVADGRLYVSGILVLGPHLTPGNANELIAAAAHKSRDEILAVLADRAPKPDVPTRLEPIPTRTSTEAPAQVVGEVACVPPDETAESLAPGRVIRQASSAAQSSSTASPDRGKSLPLGAERFALQATIRQETQVLLRRAQELLSPAVHPNDLDQVLHRALELLVRALEKKKFGISEKPAAGRQVPRRRAKGGRHIPSEVREAVYQRDGGQCMFVSGSGHRCEARRGLEFHHIHEFARGGDATVGNIQLRCRAHNQYDAEQAYGAEFMQGKRERTKARAAAKKSEKSQMREGKAGARRVTRAEREQDLAARAAAQQRALEEFPWLREMQSRTEAPPSS